MPGFKTTKRKVTVTKEVRVCEVGSNADAAQILSDYCNISGSAYAEKYGIKPSGFDAYLDGRCLAYAAAQQLLRAISERVSPEELIERGITPDVPCVITPTWTSSDGRTVPLTKMPTPYLQSVRRFAANMGERDERNKPRGQGLVDAIDAELDRRDENEANEA